VFQFLPGHGVTAQSHGAQEPARQVHLAVAVGAQCALKREQPGDRRREAG
jgi:hypothetical protein